MHTIQQRRLNEYSDYLRRWKWRTYAGKGKQNLSENPIDFNTFENEWCDTTLTDLQRQEMFKKYKGKYITWTGEVSAISETWGDLTLQVKHCPDSLTTDIIITMKDNQKDKLLKLKEGDTVTYKAKLERFGTILGLSAEDGEII